MQTVSATRSPESRAYEFVRRSLAGTPGRLRVYGAIAIAACVLFGGVGFLTVRHLNNELISSRRDAEQLVRLQTIRTSLVKADAAATNAFLVGGLEPADTRAQYTQAIDTAAATLAEASAANGDDAKTLADVNKAMAVYTGLIESARANNRQGLPSGAAYLRSASTSLSENALPPLQQLVDAGIARANASSSASDARQQLFWITAIALVVMLALSFWLYRRTHRVINQPLLVAMAIIAVLGLLAIAVIAWSDHTESNAREDAYTRTVALANARINAFDAKSAESLTLILRGSGTALEQRWQTSAATARYYLTTPRGGAVTGGAEPETAATFDKYVVVHARLRKLDTDGKYDDAVRAATGNGDESANTTFANFDDISARTLDDRADQLTDDLNRARLPLIPTAWTVLLGGIVAAFAARRGFAQRLREYR